MTMKEKNTSSFRQEPSPNEILTAWYFHIFIYIFLYKLKIIKGKIGKSNTKKPIHKKNSHWDIQFSPPTTNGYKPSIAKAEESSLLA